MQKHVFIFAITMCLLSICQASWASNAYVTDTFRISLRRGPSVENKILKFIPSGQPVEIMETQEGWSRIRSVDPGQTGLEGWVLSRYLISRQPWKNQVESLAEENNKLINDLTELKKNYKTVLEKEQALNLEVQKYIEALGQSKAEYAQLKADASGINELMTSNEHLKAQTAELREENAALKASQRNRFLATGALVLLCGLMIGLLFGRQERRKKGYY